MKLGGGGTSVTDDCRNEKAAQNGTFVLITHNQSRRLDVEVSPDARRAGQEYGRHVGAGGGTHILRDHNTETDSLEGALALVLALKKSR